MNQADKLFDAWLRSRENGLDQELLDHLQGEIVLIKYGGNAMDARMDDDPVLDQIALLSGAGLLPVVVHGGGPAIRKLLEETGLKTEFVDGHRKTDKSAMRIVEMALSGEVNGKLVKELNRRGVRAVGLSGKDASMVSAERRYHETMQNGKLERVDIGYVGNVTRIDPALIHILLEHNYLPVVAPVAVGEDGNDYNINADMFAGHLAGALHAAVFIAVTNVDGLRRDITDPESLIEQATSDEIRSEMGKSIQGGMIPKVESCLIALEQGVEKACIVHGMKPDRIVEQLLTQKRSGTTITP